MHIAFLIDYFQFNWFSILIAWTLASAAVLHLVFARARNPASIAATKPQSTTNEEDESVKRFSFEPIVSAPLGLITFGTTRVLRSLIVSTFSRYVRHRF